MKVPDAKNFPQPEFLHRYKVIDVNSRYKILWSYKSAQSVFLCLKCEILSYSLKDVEHRYCGSCHEFKDEQL